MWLKRSPTFVNPLSSMFANHKDNQTRRIIACCDFNNQLMIKILNVLLNHICIVFHDMAGRRWIFLVFYILPRLYTLEFLGTKFMAMIKRSKLAVQFIVRHIQLLQIQYHSMHLEKNTSSSPLSSTLNG